jgi:hypothetical protein
MRKSTNTSSFGSKDVSKKDRFNSLNLNIMKRKISLTKLGSVKLNGKKSKIMNSYNSHVRLEISLEKSLEKMDNIENLTRNDILAYRYYISINIIAQQIN